MLAIKIILSLFLWIFFVSLSKNVLAQKDVPIFNSRVVTINDVDVSRHEFVSRMQWLKGHCFDHFIKQGGLSGTDNNFWSRSINDINPLEWIKKESLEQLIKEKVTLHLMQQYKVLEGFNYRNFLTAYHSENKKRKDTIAKGEIIYGVQAFNELSFYGYIFSNARLQTQKQILKINPPANDEIKKQYEKEKEKEFKIPGTITVTKVTFEADKKITPYTIQLKLNVRKGKVQNTTSLINDPKHRAELSYRDITFDPSSIKSNEMLWGNVMDQAYKLDKTRVMSPLFMDENGDECFLLYKKIVANGYLPFDEVKENIRMQWAEEQLKEMVRKGIGKALVQINTEEWRTLDMESPEKFKQ